MRKAVFILNLFFISISTGSYAQWHTNNNATQTSASQRCFRLTQESANSAGQVWNTNLFNLNNRFEIYATVNFGDRVSGGGKGIAFLFHQGGLLAGMPNPGNMGYTGISPSVAVELDVTQDAGHTDPPFDHAALMRNGSVDHSSANNLDGPAALNTSLATVKDGEDHQLHVIWEPSGNSFKAWFDCNLVIDYTGNIINTVFGSDPMVYWGFTGGTDNFAFNEQTFCIDYVSTQQPALKDTTACEGILIPLDAGFGDSYVWSPAAGLSDDSIRIPLASPSSTTTYTVSIYDSCGIFRTESYTHTILDSNTAVLSGDTITCEGVPVPLNFDVTGEAPFFITINDGSSNTTMQLDSNGNDLSTGQPVTVTPTGTVTYTISNFAGQSSCGNSYYGSATITLDILNNIQRSSVDATCHGSCNGSAQFFIPHTTPSYTYIWPDFTGGTSKSQLCAGNYDVAVDNGDGCQDTIDFVINEPDPIEISGLNNITACANETISVTANVTGGSGNYIYSWNTGESTQTIDVYSTQTTTYRLTVTDDNNCPSAIESFELVIRPLLDVEVSTDTGLCIGEIMEIYAFASGGDSNYNYLWNDAAGTTSDTLIANPLNTFNYEVTVTDGCGSDPQTASVNIRVDVPPDLSYSVSSPACEGQPVQFTMGDLDTAADYTMYFNRGYPPEVIDKAVFERVFSHTGCYDIVIEAENKYCDSVKTDSCAFIVNLTPEAQFEFEPDTAANLSDFEVRYNNTTQTPVTNIFWILDDEIISSEEEFEYSFPDSGTHNMMLVVENAAGCADSVEYPIYVRSEPQTFFVPNAFSPNGDGVNDTFKPFINDRNIQNYIFRIFNRWGQIVFETSDLDDAWDGSVNNARDERIQEIYIWQVTYVDFRGEDRKEEGTVLLYR